jgi:hypothetical protein
MTPPSNLALRIIVEEDPKLVRRLNAYYGDAAPDGGVDALERDALLRCPRQTLHRPAVASVWRHGRHETVHDGSSARNGRRRVEGRFLRSGMMAMIP